MFYSTLKGLNEMQITQEELERRLNSPKNLTNILAPIVVKTTPTAPREPQVKGNIVRAVAGALATIDTPRNTAQAFDMTLNQVNSAKNSTRPDVQPAVKSAISRVQELALSRLMESLNLLTPESLIGEKPRDLARIASDLSRVIDRTTPRDVIQNTQLIIYAPQQRGMDKYQLVDV
jgi:hypothetical protein